MRSSWHTTSDQTQEASIQHFGTVPYTLTGTKQNKSVAAKLLCPVLPSWHHGVGLSNEDAGETKHGNAAVPVLSPATDTDTAHTVIRSGTLQFIRSWRGRPVGDTVDRQSKSVYPTSGMCLCATAQ
jgi:hypothetical protein